MSQHDEDGPLKLTTEAEAEAHASWMALPSDCSPSAKTPITTEGIGRARSADEAWPAKNRSSIPH